MAKTELRTYTPEQVWTAAAYAYRKNKGFVRANEGRWDDSVVSNRDIMKDALIFIDVTTFTKKDKALGADALRFHSQALTLKSLTTPALSDFERTLSNFIAQTAFTEKDTYAFAIIASQIDSYVRQQKQIKLEDKLEPVRDVFGKVKERLEFSATVISSVYSRNYGVYFVHAVTDTHHKIRFTSSNGVNVGDVIKGKGTVREHNTKESVTILNRVKLED